MCGKRNIFSLSFIVYTVSVYRLGWDEMTHDDTLTTRELNHGGLRPVISHLITFISSSHIELSRTAEFFVGSIYVNCRMFASYGAASDDVIGLEFRRETIKTGEIWSQARDEDDLHKFAHFASSPAAVDRMESSRFRLRTGSSGRRLLLKFWLLAIARLINFRKSF